MITITNKFVQKLINKLQELSTNNSDNETLGYETRYFLANYNYPTMAVYWWYDMFPNPPELEDDYIVEAMNIARKNIDNDSAGRKLRKLTQEFWAKPGHTLVWSKFHKNIE